MHFNGGLDTERITGELCGNHTGVRIAMLLFAAFCACHLQLGPDLAAMEAYSRVLICMVWLRVI